uniref:Uncharacterized protein n=1 Tax=Oryza meridionalis TaxID=40149 RepID=A0A0E0CPV1_9ORYZ
MAIPKPLIALAKLLAAIREALQLMLFVVGICHHPERSGRPAAVDAPLPDEVKDRLPPLEFAQLLAASEHGCHGCDDDEAVAGCIVCLERLEADDVLCPFGFFNVCKLNLYGYASLNRELNWSILHI